MTHKIKSTFFFKQTLSFFLLNTRTKKTHSSSRSLSLLLPPQRKVVINEVSSTGQQSSDIVFDTASSTIFTNKGTHAQHLFRINLHSSETARHMLKLMGCFDIQSIQIGGSTRCNDNLSSTRSLSISN